MKVVLGIAYNGSNYYGWQRQENVPTIQAHVEDALSFVADQNISVICAGRTDRGVHATGQIVHFETEIRRSERAWVLGANTRLPHDIRVRWACFSAEDFHARFSAVARRYRYVIYNQPVASALLPYQVTTHYKSLDSSRMHQAGQHLLGEHDFTSYRAIECQAKSPVRNIYYLNVSKRDKFIFIDVKANGFLHHMVRNITGVLLAIGEGKREPIWTKEILEARDRTLGGVTAPPCGLYFMEAFYSEHFNLPRNNAEPLLWD